MTSISETDITYYLKEKYVQNYVNMLMWKDFTLLGMIKKNPDAEGKYTAVPATYAGGHGIATTVAQAQTNNSPTKGVEFLVPCAEMYAVLQIKDKALKQSKSDKGSFVRGIDHEVKGILRNFGAATSVQLWGDGGTPVGRRSSASTNVITLTNADDVNNFFVGMPISASSATGASTSDTLRTGSTTVASVQREAGTVTLTSAAAITNFADNDYLFHTGLFAGATVNVIMKGLGAWNPASAPSSTLFHNVDRTVDDYLSGARLPSGETSGTLLDRIRKLASYSQTRLGTNADWFFVHPRQIEVAASQQEWRSYQAITARDSMGIFGYNGIEFRSAFMSGKLLGDLHCGPTQLQFINSDVVELQSLGPIARPMDDAGYKMQWVYNEAAWEQRWATYANPVVWEQNQLARATLETVV